MKIESKMTKSRGAMMRLQEVSRKMGVDQLCAVHRWTVWGLLRLFKGVYIHLDYLYMYGEVNEHTGQ